jgi:putative transcriptional regulator
VAAEVDLRLLGQTLGPLHVTVLRRRRFPEPAALLVAVRNRHGLSQREFADMLGLDVRTLQNWEQGRNRPDAAALHLVVLFDRLPELIEDAAFESVMT